MEAVLALCFIQLPAVNHVSAPYMTVCMVISLLKIPYVHRIHLKMYGSGQPYARQSLCLRENRVGSRGL